MPHTTSTDLLGLLVKRYDIINCLSEGINDKRKLENATDLSRSALNEALKELRENGLITEYYNGHQITQSGEIALDIFKSTWIPYATIHPYLSLLPDGKIFEKKVIKGASITEADLSDPDRPIGQFEKLIQIGNQVVGMSPVFQSRLIEVLYNRINNGLSADLLISSPCFEILWEKYPNIMYSILELEKCTVFKMVKEPPFSIFIIDGEQIWLGIHDERGNIVAAISNDSTTAVQWALKMFNTFQKESSLIFHET